MKKIAILYSGSKNKGGVNSYLAALFDLYDKKEVELTLFSMGQWDLTEQFHQKKYGLRVFSGERFNLVTVYKIARELREGHYNLIVSQGVVANAYARAASALSAVPNLVAVHSDLEFDYSNGFIKGAYRASDIASRWRTSKYIAVSDFLKTKLIETGVAPEKITVIYNGIDESRLEGFKPHKPSDSKISIGSFGRLHPVKNYENLIRAVAETENVELLIYGQGEEEENLRTVINELGASEKVRLMGRTENPSEALSRIDLYLQPSLSEGFGIGVVEAQYVGIPVAVTDRGSLPEIVIDGKTGYVSAGVSAEALRELIAKAAEDRSNWPKIAATAQKDAKEKFNPQNWAQKTIDAYKKAAK